MSRFVDIHEYMPVLIGILREGRDVSLLVSGSSMSPFLVDKRDTVILSPPDSEFRRGDIVFYQRSNGQYIMHRIHHVGTDGMLYIVGDGELVIEGPVEPERVFGITRKVIRKGKMIDGKDFWWCFFEKIWIRMVPLRPFAHKLYSWIGRKQRKIDNMDENKKNDPEQDSGRIVFESLEILVKKWMDGSLTEILDDWKWIFSYSKKYKWAIVYSTVMGLISTTMGLISSVASKYLIDIITGYKTEYLGLLVALMVGPTIFSLVIGNWLGRFNLKLSIKINQDIRADIFDKIMDAEWLAMNEYSNGDLLNRFNSDTGTISSNAIGWLPSIVLVIYNFIATFILILYYDSVMAIFAFASAPFMFLVSAVVMKKRRAYAKKAKEMSSDIMSFEVETFYNFDTIKAFGITSHYSKKFRWWQEKSKNLSLEQNMFNIKISVFTSIIGTIIEGSAFFYCLWRLWTKDITYGTMQLFLSQKNKLASAFSGVTGIIPAFLNTSISAHRIRELVDLPREMHIPESSDMDTFMKDGFEVEMKDVDFSYVEEKRIITDSAFKASPGEIVALVGPSGEGKTTMIRLILGLIHPQEGQAVLKASNGKEVELNADTRHLFAYVPQGNTILSGTIAENMRMVKEDATDEEIIEALQGACAWDFVKNMPDTINCKIGERGRGFSEGQAQRIAIARAILRDAPILLLDEATSALDVTTERQVLRNIIKQHPNKTCIVTTHRPSVLNMCQRVYRVMETKVTELSEEESSKMAMDF